jgi:pimeloyl-ACP methyl ester carboxylesterase
VSEPAFSTIVVADTQLRAATWGSGAPQVVMLHDGLGSIPQWRSVPAQVAARTGRTVLAYERAGHGQSLPTPTGPWSADWLHREAQVLERVIAATGADHPILVGHSDGGSTALIYAAQPQSRATAVLALAPHSWVEQLCFDSIVAMRLNCHPIEAGLARHHRDAKAIFEAWSGVWVSDDFRTWDIRPELVGVSVPTLIAQGADDAYASDYQAHLTAGAIGANATSVIVPGVGHIMHHDDADVINELIAEFVEAHG